MPATVALQWAILSAVPLALLTIVCAWKLPEVRLAATLDDLAQP
ncbi:hypothetical protein [Nocardioides aromaticivorans]|nr:hypothetical protein [Nocardioides aromaticivorans]